MALFNFKKNTNQNENKKKRAVFKYFEIIYTKFSKLILLNLMYFACITPLLCGIIYFTCVIFGASAQTVQAFFFVHMAVWITELIPLPVFIVLFIASLLAYGPLTAGFTYCIRNIVTGKHFWMSEMFSHAKSNLKQGLFFGIIDITILFSLILYLASDISALQGASLVFYRGAKILAVIISVIYFCIRFYTYSMAVTFELSVKDIFKNSLIFCVLGFFRNIISILLIAFISFTFTSTPKVDLVLMATLFFSICRFSAVFSTYPIIEKYMLKVTKKAEQSKTEEIEKE